MTTTFIDTLPYRLFQKMKVNYATHTILLTPDMVGMPGVLGAYSGPEEYVTALFKRDGIEVYRYRHNYKTLEGENPELGLVFMSNDSVIVPGLEVTALLGHNARAING